MIITTTYDSEHWQVVPKVPTDEMYRAFLLGYKDFLLMHRLSGSEPIIDQCINAGWDKLLAAAPPAPGAWLPTALPLAQWHEDYGPVVWWSFPVEEPAWIGTPLDDEWPGYHTHWTPHPGVPAEQAGGKVEG